MASRTVLVSPIRGTVCRQRLPAAEAALASAMEQLNSSLASTAPQCSKQSTRPPGIGKDYSPT
eukprot:6143223-Amphidinium_carterae.1